MVGGGVEMENKKVMIFTKYKTRFFFKMRFLDYIQTVYDFFSMIKCMKFTTIKKLLSTSQFWF
jgi:hypothetical protein